MQHRLGGSMGELKECAICGAAYSNGIKHQRFHDELEELMARMRVEVSEPAGGRRRRHPST